jgi:hypothetical protein
VPKAGCAAAGTRGVVLEYWHHPLVLLLGIVVAGLSLFGAIAIGPYGRSSAHVALAAVAFAAVLGSAFWLFSYFGLVEQRRSIETRLAELRAQALSGGSTLACLDRAGDAVETACAQMLFAAPETLASRCLDARYSYRGARRRMVIAIENIPKFPLRVELELFLFSRERMFPSRFRRSSSS